MLAPDLAQDRRDGAQAARHVGHLDVQARQAPVADEAPHDDRRQQPRVDVAARQHDADRAPREPLAVLDEGGDAGGARALGDHLLDLEEQVDGLLDVFLADGDDVVDERLDDPAGEVAGRGDGDALGDRRPADGGRRVVHAIGHRRVALGLHAHQLDAGLQVAGRHRHARQQAAAAHGDHQRVELGVVGQHLEGARALPGDDGRVVERVDVGAALVGGQAGGLGRGLGDALAPQHDRGPQLAGALHLHEGRVGGHDDRGVDAEPGGVVGDGLGVVAGRHGHHALGPLAVVELEELVEGAALLEGRDELQVLELHHHRAPEDRGQGARVGAGRALDRAGDAARRGHDVVVGDGEVGAGGGVGGGEVTCRCAVCGG